MTGWDVSRHPEWDMMYAAKVAVRDRSLSSLSNRLCHHTGDIIFDDFPEVATGSNKHATL